MSKLKLVLIFILLSAGSCLRATDERCKSIVTSESQFKDSIPSGLEVNDGIYAVSIRLKGRIENEIQFDEFLLPSGQVDTLISNRDYYSPTFHYELFNKSGGDVELDVCIGFAYSPN